MNAFIGTVHAKTDVKGRVFIPAPFRKILQSLGESSLILRKDIHQDCLVLYPGKAWEEELNKLQEQLEDWGDEDRQQTFRMISALVEPVDMDSSGRILISKKYLQAAKISNTVCFIGMNNYIEIWNPDQFTKTMMSADELKGHVRKFLSKPRKNNENNN